MKKVVLILSIVLAVGGFSQILVDKDKGHREEDKILGKGINGPYYRPGPTSEYWWKLGRKNEKVRNAQTGCDPEEQVFTLRRGTQVTIKGAVSLGVKWPPAYQAGVEFSGEKTWSNEEEITIKVQLGPCRWYKLLVYQQGRSQECFFVYLKFHWPSGTTRTEYSRTREEWDWHSESSGGELEDCNCSATEEKDGDFIFEENALVIAQP